MENGLDVGIATLIQMTWGDVYASVMDVLKEDEDIIIDMVEPAENNRQVGELVLSDLNAYPMVRETLVQILDEIAGAVT